MILANAGGGSAPAAGDEPIALLGGTFDPVHYGHLRFADAVRRELGLHDVRLVPSALPPHREPAHARAADRLAMLDLAVREFPGLVVDAREIVRGGRSYTVDTLEALRREHPATPLVLLVGADAFRGLPAWHRWRDTRSRLVAGAREAVGHWAAREVWADRTCRNASGTFWPRHAIP